MVAPVAIALVGLAAGVLSGVSNSRTAKKRLRELARMQGISMQALLKGITPYFTDEKGQSTLTKLLNANTNKAFALAQKDMRRAQVRAGLRDAGSGQFQNTGLSLLRGEQINRNLNKGMEANLQARRLQVAQQNQATQLLAQVPPPQEMAGLLGGMRGLAGGIEAASIISPDEPFFGGMFSKGDKSGGEHAQGPDDRFGTDTASKAIADATGQERRSA
jgi:hypothetical protein